MGPASWTSSLVADCLLPVSVRGKAKIKKRDYQESGRFPVVDQGQELIAGWTDDETAVIEAPLPLIVFGDHTRAFKYVDFPFTRGADGTQLLKPIPDIDPLFFYYACRAIDLPARGYNRHFTVLKEKEISYPADEAEQKAIASVLRKVESLLIQQSTLIHSLEELKRAAMRELFARGLRGEPQKETEIGPVPESWTVDRLDQYARVISTRMTLRELEKMGTADSDGVKVIGIKVSDMNREGNEIELRRAALEKQIGRDIAIQRCAPPGTIVFPKRGAAIATNKKRITAEWAAFDPNVIGVIARDSINPRFLFHWFQYFDLRMITEPGPTPQLNKKHLEPLPIPVPATPQEQSDIVSVLDAIDSKIDLHRKKRAVLEELFKALLHKLMTGEIRVDELDLSALEGAGADSGEVAA